MAVCYIFGALPVKNFDCEIKDDDFVIAADKGLLNTKNLKIKPDLVVGDFDSLGYCPNENNVISLPVRKDDTDVGFAVKEGIKRGYKLFHIYGAIGGLLDHTYANLQLSAYAALHGARAYFYDENMYAVAIHNDSIFFDRQFGRVSVFAVGDTAKGVYEKNMSFELDDAVLSAYFPLGVSNEFIGKPAEISVKDGTLLIIVYK